MTGTIAEEIEKMKPQWIKFGQYYMGYVMHKDDSPCGHEIISPIADFSQAVCWYLNEKPVDKEGK